MTHAGDDQERQPPLLPPPSDRSRRWRIPFKLLLVSLILFVYLAIIFLWLHRTTLVSGPWAAMRQHHQSVVSILMSIQSCLSNIDGSRIKRMLSSGVSGIKSSPASGSTENTRPAAAGSKTSDDQYSANTGRGNGLAHPAQNVMVQVTGDERTRSRMGRACQPVAHSNAMSGAVDTLDTSVNGDAADIGEEGNCIEELNHAVELRPGGALQSTTPASPPSWSVLLGSDNVQSAHRTDARKQDPRGTAFGEAQVGMTIQVFPLDWSDDENKYEVETITTDRSDKKKQPLSPHALGRIDVTKEEDTSHLRSVACVSPQYVGSSSDQVVEYQLVEKIKTRLGLVDTHEFDYMYKPVLSLSDGSDKANDGDIVREEETTSTKDPHRDREDDEEAAQQLPMHDRYEWMEDHAFAGGSHGEVWHARRRCPSRQTKKDRSTPATSPLSSSLCDDKRQLVMKRLKVEHGYDILEAGLREVYFGEYLNKNIAGASDYFTTYVDHFFREVPARLQRPKSASSRNHVELWIVFEDAGPSLRSFLYSPVTSVSGDFVVYQHSAFWRRLRRGVVDSSRRSGSTSAALSTILTATDQRIPFSPSKRRANPKFWNKSAKNETLVEGKILIKEVLRQILMSAAALHDNGIVHRDIKPSNIMCNVERHSHFNVIDPYDREVKSVDCKIGDFSSAVDEFTVANLYKNGPSAAEQTNEYAPPEALFGPVSAFEPTKPESYDSWSVGVVILEMLLGTPNVFSVDQRTKAILTAKMEKQGSSEEEIQRVLYLAALSNFCIFLPSASDWPLRPGAPLFGSSFVRKQCNLSDFHSALRARDPLGLGFDASSDQLLLLILGLLHWDPQQRLSASGALQHPYFQEDYPGASSPNASSMHAGGHNALAPQALDPNIDVQSQRPEISEFLCPKCGKRFDNLNSCLQHSRGRRHAKFCLYDHSQLPPCLNAHAMLPAHPTSGYCDIQGRRPTIEDFHTVHLHPHHMFLGVFDGHNGNLASKYAAALFYDQLVERLSDLDADIENNPNWKDEVASELTDAFSDLHNGIVNAIARSPEGVMKSTGTTATALYTTEAAVVLANVGDSRAILSNGKSKPTQLTIDHVASNKNEQERIKSLGGFVSSVGGTPRVNGTLAVSRSLGDVHLASLLSRVPHVVAMSRDEIHQHCEGNKEDLEIDEDGYSPCFMVIASDGLWDVMDNQEVSDMVVEVMEDFDPESHGISLEEGGAFQEAAQRLTHEAYVRGSMDNIGVCVLSV